MTMKNQDLAIDCHLSSERSKDAADNRLKLASIAETVLFCARQGLAFRGHRDDSLVPRHQIFRVRPAALSKNRVWTPSLVKLGRNYTSVVSCSRTNQIAQVK